MQNTEKVYDSNASLPKTVQVLPSKAQSMWRKVFNSSYERNKNENRAIREAWAAVKREYEKSGDRWVKKGLFSGLAKLFSCGSGAEEAAHEPENKKQVTVKSMDEENQIVYGYGIICKKGDEDYFDTDNEHIPEEVMRKASTEFMLGKRVSNVEHTDTDVGVVVHSFPLTKEIAEAHGISAEYYGWLVGVKTDKSTLAKFKSGEYTGFSIEGKGVPVEV